MNPDSPERSTSLPLWLLGVIVVGSATVLGVPLARDITSPAEAPARPAQEEKQPAMVTLEQLGPDEPLSVLREFFRVKPIAPSHGLSFTLNWNANSGDRDTAVSIASKSARSREPENLAGYMRQEPAQYEFLIATVPDPVDSKFALEFDAVINAIQRAFEARDFTLRSSWLPWHRREISSAAGQSNKAHRDEPGMLLFYKPANDTSPLPTISLVCLVGETPTAGIHKPALTRALELRDHLDNGMKQADVCWTPTSQCVIRIVAPYFSGSQSSLLLTLKENKAKRMSFKVISGGASALERQQFEEELGEGALQTTVIPEKLLIKAVVAYLAGSRSTDLCDESPKVKKLVAILRESNTRFGEQSRTKDGSKHEAGFKEEDYSEKGVIDLPFPLSIAQLQVKADRDSQKSPGAGLPQTGFVEPRFRVTSEPRVGIPEPFDPASAATTAGESLRAILTVIRRAHVKYVGIVATDSRDVVFLNRLIRSACPAVCVFTTEPNIALAHPDEAYHLRGMVVASTYPLNPVTQYWSRSHGTLQSMIPFPTQGSEGYHNAILAHLGEDTDCDAMLDYRSPGIPGLGSRENHPPIWISVVGQNGRLIPVHCSTQFSSDLDFASGPVESAEDVPFPMSIGVLLMSWVALAVLALMLVALLRPNLWSKWAAGPTDGEGEKDAQHAPFRIRLWIWLWRGFLIVTVLLLAIPYTLPAREFSVDSPKEWDFGHRLIFWTAIVVGLEIAAIAGLLSFRVWRVPRLESPRMSRWSYLTLALVVVALAVTTWTIWIRAAPSERFFFYYRSADLSSGLSPLVPMGLLGVCGLLISCFTLRQLVALRQISRPASLWLPCPYCNLSDEIQKAESALQNPSLVIQNRKGLRFLLGLGVPFLLFEIWNVFAISLPSVEGFCWDCTMQLAYFLVAGAMVLALARLLDLWSRLRNLLEKIVRIPMVGAFQYLPEEVRRSFRGLMYSHRPAEHDLAVVAWALPKDEREKLRNDILATHPGLAWIFGEHCPDAAQAGSEARSWLIKQLKGYAEKFLKEISSRWVNRPMDEAFGDARSMDEAVKGRETKQAEEPDSEQARAARQERYVAAYVAVYLGPYFVQLRMLAFAVAFAAPLLLFAVASYDFQPPRPLLNAPVALLVAIAVGLIYVLYRINRDGLVSRITRTVPHRFTPDTGFVSSLSVTVLPIVGILLAHVFGLFRFVLEPILGLFQ